MTVHEVVIQPHSATRTSPIHPRQLCRDSAIDKPQTSLEARACCAMQACMPCCASAPMFDPLPVCRPSSAFPTNANGNSAPRPTQLPVGGRPSTASGRSDLLRVHSQHSPDSPSSSFQAPVASSSGSSWPWGNEGLHSRPATAALQEQVQVLCAHGC